jgi:hypothetical protein
MELNAFPNYFTFLNATIFFSTDRRGMTEKEKEGGKGRFPKNAGWNAS